MSEDTKTVKKVKKNEIFTKMVNDRMSMISINTSYAAIIFGSIANAPTLIMIGLTLVVANTSQSYRRAKYELRNAS